MSTAFQRAQKRLEARKKKVKTLVQGIEEHEHERDEALQHRTKFTDPKYRTSVSSFSFRESSRGSRGSSASDTSITSSTLAADDYKSEIFETKKGGKGKRKVTRKSVSPGLKGKAAALSPGPKVTKRRSSAGHLANKRKTLASGKEAKLNVADGRGDPIIKPGARGSKLPLSSYGRQETASESRFSNSSDLSRYNSKVK